MTPQYICRKSLCRAAHCFSAHVPGKGYVNCGQAGDDIDEYNRQRIRSALAEIDNMGYVAGYAEPGHTEPEKGILFANWNVFPRELPDVLERAGYAIEWSDEWSTCEDCGKAVRTSPNGWDWSPYYAESLISEDSMVCLDCYTPDEPDSDEDTQEDTTNGQ
jgi:hypothetical protein